MDLLIRNQKKLIALLIIPLLFFTWCFSTVTYKGCVFAALSFVCAMISLFLYIRYHKLSLSDFKVRKDELRILDIMIVLSGTILSAGTISNSLHSASEDKVMLAHIWGISFDVARFCIGIELAVWAIVILCYSVLSGYIRKEHVIKAFDMCGKKLSENIWFVCVLIIAVVLCYDSCYRNCRWDGYLYYLATKELNISSLSSMAMYGHISQFHSLIVLFFTYLIPDTILAMYIANIVLYIIGGVYFYRTLLYLAPGRSRKALYAISASLFLFSPYYLGMVTFFSTDYTMMCLAPILFYYMITNRWMPFTITACFFCFTKEPAVVIYVLLCLGVVIYDFFIRHVKTLDMVVTLHYYAMLLPCLLWFAIYKLLGPWTGGVSEVGYEGNYVLNKVGVLYVLNFHWLILIVTLLLSFIAIRRKCIDSSALEWVLPLICAGIGFTLFSTFFRTANHPRYADIIPFMLYMFTAVMSLMVTDLRDRQSARTYGVVMISMALLMIMSCFVTVDPVSLHIFESVDVGNTRILKTADVIGDGSVYNRQSLWMEYLYSEAIADAVKFGNKIVVLTESGNTYEVDGMTEFTSIQDNHKTDFQCIDINKNCRIKSEESTSYEISFLSDADGFTKVKADKGDKISVIYPAFISVDQYNGMLDNLGDITKKEYKYRGWKINCIEGVYQ